MTHLPLELKYDDLNYDIETRYGYKIIIIKIKRECIKYKHIFYCEIVVADYIIQNYWLAKI